MTVLARFAREGRDELVSLHHDDVAGLAAVEALVPAAPSP